MILIHKRLFLLVSILSILYAVPVHPQKKHSDQSEIQQAVDRTLRHIHERVTEITDGVDDSVARANEAIALAHSSNGTAIRAFETATEAQEIANEAAEAIDGVRQQAQTAATRLEHEYDRLSAALAEQIERGAETARSHNDLAVESKIQIEQAKIREKLQRGIYREEEKARVQASVEAEKTRWDKISSMIQDPKFILKLVLAVGAVAAAIYLAKHGIPKLVNYFTRPGVITETSQGGWFGWDGPEQIVDLNDLIFAPPLKKQLFDLALRVKSAKEHNENLPNILLYGPPGTGKTAFARALAHSSCLDYALTSGSEFAKITDLNLANNELRKLLDWAQNSSDKGLIVFIDEAESLFANRALPTTPKIAQDFINTFLHLIPEKSQKNLMFIFATNHPFKLDDAITNRIGINIEFTLPEAPEREKILALYLEKLAQSDTGAKVTIAPKVIQKLPLYAKDLEGLSPRAIKFVAEEMVINARRQEFKLLTNNIAQKALADAKRNLQQTAQWESQRDQWAKALALHHTLQ